MKSREQYSPEFRAEAVRLVLEQSLGQAEAARGLGIAKGTLSNWVVAAKGGKDTSAIPGARFVAELEAEVAQLRKSQHGADIIKKPQPTLLRSHCQVRVDSQATGSLSLSVVCWRSLVRASTTGASVHRHCANEKMNDSRSPFGQLTATRARPMA